MTRKRFQLFPSKLGFYPFVWLVYIILPIFNIRNETGVKLFLGYALIALFVVTYRQLYWATSTFSIWLGIQMLIIVIMSVFYNPFNLYMGFFTANFIGYFTERRKFNMAMVVFVAVEIVPLALVRDQLDGTGILFMIPFVIIMMISPFGIRSMNRRQNLERELDLANEQIKELVKREERMRIARDLHDTLGHTLSLITLKSQLVEKLALKDPQRAQFEAGEIQRTSRAALRQVRELVSDMRAITVAEELAGAGEILKSADITLEIEGDALLDGVSDLTQNILSLCIKEAMTNIVKHSQARNCVIRIGVTEANVSVDIEDDGIGLNCKIVGDSLQGNGLKGMAERLSLIEGTLNLSPGTKKGTRLLVTVPLIVKDRKEGEPA